MIDELTIEASHKCNLNCLFCSSRDTLFNINPEDRLSLEKIIETIQAFKPKVIRWSGGEPFFYLNQPLLEKTSAFDFPINHAVTTNGTLTAEAVNLAPYFSEIRVSVFGDEKTHEELTRVPGSWGKAMQTLQSLKDKLKDSMATKLLITSPYISKSQMQEVKDIAEKFMLGTRITGLVPNALISRPDDTTESDTCSQGDETCHYHQKRLILPNGRIIHCAVEKIGFNCPYINVSSRG